MPVPKLSHLQFLVLECLLLKAAPGRGVREYLAKYGERKSLPGFYQLMARLEDAGLVKGRYDTIVVDGQTLRRRWYEINPDGRRAHREVAEFYQPRAPRRRRASYG